MASSIMFDRSVLYADESQYYDHDGDHHGEDRAPNEDISHNVLLFCARFVGLRFDTHAGAQFVEAVGNNLLTGLEAGIDHPHRPDSLAQRNDPLLGSVIGSEDINTVNALCLIDGDLRD